MRKPIPTWLFSFFLVPILLTGYALAGEADLERIAKIISAHRSTFAATKVYEPEQSSFQTRSRQGPELYRRTVTGTVLVATEVGLGSGVRIGKNIIVSNWHIVQGEEVVVILFWRPDLRDLSEKDFVYAHVLGTDKLRDLAVLYVDPKDIPSYVTIIQTSRLSEVSVGQDVYAIGHPQKLWWSYTEGVVSQVRPDFPWSYESSTHRATVIQTQTPIGSGSSGGPLFDQKGHLVGLNTMMDGSPGLNFAVAADEVNAFTFDVISRYRK